MATTTNYGWVTPDDTALVKDGAAAIRTLGSSADTTTKNLNPETTLGDISFRSSTSNVKTRLGIGTAGQVLTVVAGLPAYATPAAGGKVLQVIRSTDATSRSTTSASFTDASISVSITPTANTSKILLLWSFRVYIGGAATDGAFQITNSANTAISGAESAAFGNASLASQLTLVALDSPATTSATTYKGRFFREGGSSTVNIQNAQITGQLYALEIGA